jgi:hypothetical protein
VKENESHHPNIKHPINGPNYVEIHGNSLLNHGFVSGLLNIMGKGFSHSETGKPDLTGPSSWVETNTLPPMCPPRGEILQNKSTFSMGQSCRNMDRTGDRIYNEYMRMPWL